jgi:cyclic beta-1,2-glucan synthetase
VTAYYVNATGDSSILDELIPFLAGDVLGTEEEERYGQFAISEESGTLLDHCKRAIQKASTSGVHGIPLMNGGDWNDGMNRVGINGKGESVWLGWFLYATLEAFGQILEMREGDSLAQSYRRQAASLREALENNAWDGEWYIRAFYDDGTPLGSSTSEECKIDSIAQSWGVISGAAAPERARKAMQSVVDKLVKPEIQIVQLFDPPFDKTTHDPGYIKGYLPGIRENGGQYTHAAEWVALAFAQLGDGDMAEWIFRLLNPIYHSDTPEKAVTYRVEPYVVAADIYSRHPHAGRGGWTWYTGSASWMYRTGIEGILGIHRMGNFLEIDPCIPRNWPGFEASIKIELTTYFINVDNSAGVNHGINRIQVDGVDLPTNRIELNNEKPTRHIFVQLGKKIGGIAVDP